MSTKLAKWRRWHAIIGRDLVRLCAWRDEWRSLGGGPEVIGSRRAFIDEVYAHALAMGLRRQLKSGSRDVSLVRLLDDVATNVETLRPLSEEGATTAAAVRRDLAALRRMARPAEAFADRVVAHSDRRAGRKPPLTNLHEALAMLERLHAVYGARLGVLPTGPARPEGPQNPSTLTNPATPKPR